MVNNEAPSNDFDWCVIWKLHLTQRIRLFLWRLVLNKLATAQQLNKKGIGIDPSCIACGTPNEDADHLFRRCYYVNQIWMRLLPYDQQYDFDNLPWSTWISSNLRKTRKVQGVAWNLIFAASVWWIWRWRNDKRYKTESEPIPYKAASFIVNYARDMANAWNKSTNTTSIKQLRHIEVQWLKPMDGWKLNIDGCAKGNPRLAAASGLIRNEQGNWVLGFTYNMGIASSVTAEVAAMWLGMKKLVQMQPTNVEIETDSLMLVDMLRNNISNNSLWRAWIEDCQSILQQHSSFQVNHIYRKANKCADLLANFGLNQPIGEHYLDQPPVFLWTQLENDKQGDMTLRVTNGL